MKIVATVTALLVAVPAHAAIFGVDNRQLLTSASPQASLGRSVAIAVLSANYSTQPNGTIDLAVDALPSLCRDERFSTQPSLSYSCTGFLVGPDLLATAGHCVYAVNTPDQVLEHQTELACKSFLWLFDYQSDARGVTKTKGLPASNLYRCKEIIYGVQKEKAPFDDYALIRLDRKVVGRQPLKIATTEPASGQQLFMMGHPFGIPLTITSEGRVTLSNPARTSYVTSLDAFEGNSGGPVLNANQEVVGILVGGTPSLNTYEDTAAKCERYNRCSEDGSVCKAPDKDTSIFPAFQKVGSDVQRIGPIRKLVSDN
jgi:V8-like Glu-specific endopeptidase